MSNHEEQNHHPHHKPNEEAVLVTEIAVVEDGVIVEEIIDIEIYAKEDKKPPHAKGYRIRIDKDYKVVHVPKMTGREILGLVGKTPEKYLLSQKHRSGKVTPVSPDQEVDFRHHGIERFQTLALDPTEG
jgi:hypothetical protein